MNEETTQPQSGAQPSVAPTPATPPPAQPSQPVMQTVEVPQAGAQAPVNPAAGSNAQDQSYVTYPPQSQGTTPPKKRFPVKTLLLILVLFAIAAGLVFLALTLNSKKPTPTQQTTIIPTPTVDPVQTTLQISSNAVKSASSAAYTADISIQSGDDKITSVQLELLYDPKQLRNVEITQGSFFQNPTVALKKIDPVTGRISFALTTSPQNPAVTGTGTLAVLKFTPFSAKTASASVTFLPKTEVRAQGVSQSVLKSTVDALFTFTSALSPSLNLNNKATNSAK